MYKRQDNGLLRVTGNVRAGAGGLTGAEQIEGRGRNVNFPGVTLTENTSVDGYKITNTVIDGIAAHVVTFDVVGSVIGLPQLVNKPDTLLSYLITLSTHENDDNGIPGTRQEFLGARGVFTSVNWSSHSVSDEDIVMNCRFVVDKHFRWLQRQLTAGSATNNADDGGDWNVLQEGVYANVNNKAGTGTRSRGAYADGTIADAVSDHNESTVSPFRLMTEDIEGTQRSMLTGVSNTGFVWTTKRA